MFIDSADIDEIKEAFSWGIVSGITTSASVPFSKTAIRMATWTMPGSTMTTVAVPDMTADTTGTNPRPLGLRSISWACLNAK